MKESKLEKISKVAHEVSSAFYVNTKDNLSAESWEKLSKDRKNNIMKSVKVILDDPTMSPRTAHEYWVDNMIESGWVYGKEFSFEEKTTPQMMSYNSLPPLQRGRDRLFFETVKLLKSNVN